MSEAFRRALDAAVLAAQERSYLIGNLGRINSDGSVTVAAERPGYVYVRIGSTGQQGTSIARNFANVPLQANLPVRMRREHGVLVIHGGVSSGIFDSTVPSNPPNIFGVAKHHHRIGSDIEYEVEAKMLEPGRVRPYSGLTVYINLFRYYTGTAWETWPGGTLDLTSYKPATTGQWAWVLVGVDPSTNTAVAVKGADVPYATPLTIPDLDAIDFLDYIPCGAVRLRDDDTALAASTFASRFEDAHGWFSQGGGVSALADLSDVAFLGEPSEGQILTYVGGAWVNDVLLLSHSELQNLSADDHAQYVHLFGRAGGQTVAGGAGPGEGLTLESTDHATKGDIILQPNGGNVGIGNTTPNVLLSVGDDLGAYSGSKRITIGNASGPSAINLGTDSQNRVFLFWNNTSKLFAFGTRVDGTNYNSFTIDKEKVLINAPANATPEATLDVRGGVRAHDGLAGMLFWSGSGIGSAVTIIPDSTGDISARIIFFYVVNVGGVTSANYTTLGVNQVYDVPVGTGTWRFTCSTLGQLTVARASGTGTANITILGLWL